MSSDPTPITIDPAASEDKTARRSTPPGAQAPAAGDLVSRGWFDVPRNLPWALALFALAHFGAMVLGTEFVFDPEKVTVFWPGGGLLLGALVVTRTRLWPALLLISLLAQSASDVVVYDRALATSALFGLTNVLEALVGAAVLRRLFGPGFDLTRLRELVGLVLVGLSSAAVAALPGAAIVTGGGVGYWHSWQLWCLSDVIGVLLVAPLVILFTQRTLEWLAELRGWALVELMVVVAAVLAYGFTLGRHSQIETTVLDSRDAFLIVLIWAAVRFPPWTAATLVFLNALLMIDAARVGMGPSAVLGMPKSLLAVQIYLWGVAMSVLVVSTILAGRSRAEAARRRSDAGYRTLLKSVSDGVVVSRDGRYVDCNDKFLEMLKVSREEVIGKAPWEIAPPVQPDGTDSKTSAQTLIRELDRGERSLAEWRLLGGDGDPLDIEVSVATVEVAGEKLRISHVRNITERKRTEQETQERLRFEVLISDLSAKFVNLAADQVDGAITDGLRSIVEHLDLDRSVVFQMEQGAFAATHFWTRKGIPSPQGIVGSENRFPYLAKRVLEGKTTLIQATDHMPVEASAEKEFFLEQGGPKATVVFPLIAGTSNLGAVAFDSFRKKRSFPDDLVNRLRLTAEVFANALARKRSEEVLLDSEERFRAVFDATHNGLSIRRLDDLSLVAVNPAIESMTGYTLEELRELPPDGFLSPQSLPGRTESIEALRSDKAYHFDSLIGTRKDGSSVELAGSFIPFTHQGTPHTLGVIRNITERKQAEAALRQSEEKFSKAFDASPDFLAITSLEEGRILEINQSFVEITGYSREEALGRTTTELNFWMEPSERERLRQAFTEGNDGPHRTQLRMKSGELKTVDLFVVPLEVSGEPRILTVVRDITKQERARAALKESEEKFFKAFHASPIASVITKLSDSTIRDLNSAAVRTFGYSRQEVLGRTTEELFAWIDHGDREKMIKEFEEGKDANRVGARMRRKDGAEISIEISAVIIEIAGEPHLYSIADDVTERTRQEEIKERAFQEIARLKDELMQERDYLREEVKVAWQVGKIVGESPVVHEMLSRIESVASTEATVLVQGESGVGKELAAAAIHTQSPRAESPLVRVNCASIPHELFESEFFGHVKGAFTGAHRDRVGRFQLAHHGTLFLDEVAEIPMELQPKLLRALEESEFERVGDETSTKVDVRVVAATNRNLEKEMEEGRFRQDLYYRLNVFPLLVPPLRERGDDVVLLARHFVEEICRQMGLKPLAISRFQAEKLRRYDWPGNVRELRNVIEKAVILSRGRRLHLETVEVEVQRAGTDVPAAAADSAFVPYSELERQERRNLVAALEAAAWKVSGRDGAADLLGIKPTTLASKMKAMGIEKPPTTP